jgi:hypothetical protein
LQQQQAAGSEQRGSEGEGPEKKRETGEGQEKKSPTDPAHPPTNQLTNQLFSFVIFSLRSCAFLRKGSSKTRLK